jgi:hypothetical protein
MQSGGKTLTDTLRAQAAMQALRELVQREVLYQEAQRRGYKISDAEVQSGFADKLKALQEAARQANKPAPSEAELLAQSGQSRAEALASMHKTMLVGKVCDAIVEEKGGKVSDGDVQKFYKDHPEVFERSSGSHIKQIFMRPKPNGHDATPAAWAETQKNMEKAVARMKAGESFEAVAKSASESPDKDKGGDLGLVPAGQMPSFYADAVRTMKAGEVSGIIRSEHGLHLLKLVSTEQAGSTPLEEAKPKIRQMLLDEKGADLIQQFCAPVMDDSTRVQIFLMLDRRLLGNPDGEPQVKTAEAPKQAAPAAQSAPAAKDAAPAPAKKSKKKATKQ